MAAAVVVLAEVVLGVVVRLVVVGRVALVVVVLGTVVVVLDAVVVVVVGAVVVVILGDVVVVLGAVVVVLGTVVVAAVVVLLVVEVLVRVVEAILLLSLLLPGPTNRLLLLLTVLTLSSLQKFEVQMQALIVDEGSAWVRWSSQFRVTLTGASGIPSLNPVEKHSRKLPETAPRRIES